ncbi:MAG: hypothetical protein V7607_6055 [Solirubrobacteraceae bacterium]|jgi:hypothetical protein
MKFLLTLYGDETAFVNAAPEFIAREMADWQAFDDAARAAGVVIECDGLEGSHTATTLRLRDGGRHVTDGPFIETKEQLGGYVLLDVRDLDEAMAWAERCPGSYSIEIRPIMDYEAYAQLADSAEGAAS